MIAAALIPTGKVSRNSQRNEDHPLVQIGFSIYLLIKMDPLAHAAAQSLLKKSKTLSMNNF